MTEPTGSDRPLGTAALAALVKTLTDQVGNLAKEVVNLRKSLRRNWRFVLFDVLLTVALAGLGGITVHAESSAAVAHQVAAIAQREAAQARKQAAQTRAQELAFCESSNTSRSASIQVWDKLLALSAKPPPGSSVAKRLAEFTAFYRHAYAPRDCARLGQPSAQLPSGGHR